jgi:hypothetical protein
LLAEFWVTVKKSLSSEFKIPNRKGQAKGEAVKFFCGHFRKKSSFFC